MAHYAFLDKNNIVTQVIVGKNEGEDGKSGEEWEQQYAEFTGQPCKRTSYNTYGNVHINGGIPFRKNYAGIGYEYREDIDGFIPPKPEGDLVLNLETGTWEPI